MEGFFQKCHQPKNWPKTAEGVRTKGEKRKEKRSVLRAGGLCMPDKETGVQRQKGRPQGGAFTPGDPQEPTGAPRSLSRPAAGHRAGLCWARCSKLGFRSVPLRQSSDASHRPGSLGLTPPPLRASRVPCLLGAPAGGALSAEQTWLVRQLPGFRADWFCSSALRSLPMC